MAYAVPPTWQHGDYPTAVKIAKYKDGLDAIYATVGNVQLHPAVIRRMGEIESYWLVNHYRWLIYRGDGGIHDPSGSGDTVALSGSGSTWLNYDLSQVDWIFPGKLYHVEDVLGCFEDYESL
jgi:hypothetical protein